jgi:hypothetical protein
MKNRLFWLMFILIGVVLMGGVQKRAYAHIIRPNGGIFLGTGDQQVVATSIPTELPTEEVKETPESRELPPVGHDAGLVIGASVLVLIIIGGVLGARRKQNH